MTEEGGRERGCPAVGGKPRQERLSEIEDGVTRGAERERVRESGSPWLPYRANK